MDRSSEEITSRASAGRPYAAGRFALEIDGKSVSYAHAVEGGGISAEVVTDGSGRMALPTGTWQGSNMKTSA